MKITPKVALEVAHHEAIIREAYRDSQNIWTWSAGLTNASGHNVERYIGKPQSMRKCLEVFIWALENYADDVREAFNGHTLSEAQFAAALSFHWNTGAIHRASWVREWKAGNTAKAYNGFLAWRKPPEIIPRRKAERALFFSGKWSGDGKTTEYTRLTSRKTPVWGSAVKRDIKDTVEELLGERRTSDAVPAMPLNAWQRVKGWFRYGR